MNKRVYISADYDLNNGDRAVVDELVMWGRDKNVRRILLICLKWFQEP